MSSDNHQRAANFVRDAVRLLVDNEDAVSVTVVAGRQNVVLEVVAAASYTGKVIGKKGIHADAIRRIIHAYSGKVKTRYIIEIVE